MMMHDISYRKAIPADAKKLSVLYQQVYIQTYGKEGVSDEFANFITVQFSVDRLAAVLLDRPGSMIVAEYKGNLVGVAEVLWNKQAPVGNITGPELSKLYILEWFCGKGIGYGLLQAVERAVSDQGHKLMWLWVLASNDRAVAFYERQQYSCIGNASFRMEVNSYDNKVMVKQLD